MVAHAYCPRIWDTVSARMTLVQGQSTTVSGQTMLHDYLARLSQSNKSAHNGFEYTNTIQNPEQGICDGNQKAEQTVRAMITLCLHMRLTHEVLCAVRRWST